MNKFLPVAIVICLILVGGAFYGGVKYGGLREQNFAGKNMMNWDKNSASNFNNGLIKGGKAVGAGMVNGEVIAKDDKSVTVKIKDGGSKIVIFAASTAVTKTAVEAAKIMILDPPSFIFTVTLLSSLAMTSPFTMPDPTALPPFIGPLLKLEAPFFSQFIMFFPAKFGSRRLPY